MPFSLPLHRPNRQARHTDNTTQSVTPSPGPAQDGVEAASQAGDGAAEITDPPAASAAAAEQTPATTPGNPLHRANRPPPQTFHRAPPPHTLGRSSLSSSVGGRHRFDWHSVTAPPPPALPLQRSPFSTSLHRPRPLHPDRELPPAQAGENLHPPQYPSTQHQGAELGREGSQGSSQVYKCTGPEKEHRRCFTQVGSSVLFSHPLTLSSSLLLLYTPSHTFSLCFSPSHSPLHRITSYYSILLPFTASHSYSVRLTPSSLSHFSIPLTHSFSLALPPTHSLSHFLTPSGSFILSHAHSFSHVCTPTHFFSLPFVPSLFLSLSRRL